MGLAGPTAESARGRCAGLFALGLLSGQAGLLTVGALILAEELYETAPLATIIRLGGSGAT